MTTTIVVSLVLSMMANIVGVLYVRWLLRTMSELTENLEVLWVNLSGFETHVSVIHESEMYYGDKSLQELISHSKSLMDEITNIKDILPFDGEISLSEDVEEPEEGNING